VKPRPLCAAIAVTFGTFVVLALPTFAEATTTLMIVKGSGASQSLVTGITGPEQQVTTYQWSTDEPGASGATWKVTRTTAPDIAVATGHLNSAPPPGKTDQFDIPAKAFLHELTPASPLTFSITLIPHNLMNVDLGTSPTVTVTQTPAGAGASLGPNAVFPDVELVGYEVSSTGDAKLKVRLINRGKQDTDPIRLSTKDKNGLISQPAEEQVDKLANSAAPVTKTLLLKAILPPPSSVSQIVAWQTAYLESCGVDLRVVMNWRGPESQAPLNDYVERNIYIGFGDSTPTQRGTPEAPLCDATTCVSLGDVARNIHKQLDCKAVGYSFYLGRGSTMRSEGVGFARTPANPPAVNFTPTTRIPLASVSKVITALAAIKVLQQQGIDLNSAIANSFPGGWALDPNVTAKITFRQLLSQTSGIKNYGNYAMTDANLQAFYTQLVLNPTAPTACAKAPVSTSLAAVPNPIVTDTSPCYSNLNFAIFRVLLPRIAGYTGNVAAARADRFVTQVQNNVFKPVGVANSDCKPPSQNTYAFSYLFPGTTPGVDWGNALLICGGAGFTLSATELGKMMLSLNAGDGKILSPAQFRDMETNPDHAIGWDSITRGGYRWVEKNGGFTSGGITVLSTSIAIFGGNSNPGSLVPGVIGVLLINSNIASGADANGVLFKAFEDAAHPKP
jgi:CubicO group peptidase (beta-lactamase class C family)